MGWRRYLRRRFWDDERARELESYLQIETDANIARGMPPEEARYAAQRKLGNAVRIREEIFLMNTPVLVDAVWQDLKYGVRLLRLNPGFAVVAIVSLALGIGANTAIFDLLNAVRLRPLPVAHAEDLVEIRIANRDRKATGRFSGRRPELTNLQWEQIRDRQEAFAGVAAWGTTTFNLSSRGEVRNAQGIWVNGEFFDTLAVKPVLGRVFSKDDDRRGCSGRSAVISYPFWQREYAGDPGVLEHGLTLDGHPFDIIGVTPAAFYGVEVGRFFDVALPICTEPVFRSVSSALDDASFWWLAALGRLKPGWTIERATAHLGALSPSLFESTVSPKYPVETAKEYRAFKLAAFAAASGVSTLRARYEDPLLLLLGLSGLVLLIACANLANLLLARAMAREREIAVRLAMGASRGRAIRQLLSESIVLAAIGAAAGIVLARTMSGLLVGLLSTEQNPLFVDLAADWRVLGFTIAVAALACLLFGLAPAIRATRPQLGSVMKASGRGVTLSRQRFELRRALVVVQVALSLVLVVGAVLFGRTFRNLSMLDAGFRQDGILLVTVDLRNLKLRTEQQTSMHHRLLERLAAIPGVTSTAAAAIVPASGSVWNEMAWLADNGPEKKELVHFNEVSQDFFKTTGAPILAGRNFDDREVPTSPKVAIVNETFVRKMVGGRSPIGQRILVEGDPREPQRAYEVVGVVKDMRYRTLREEVPPVAFLASSQDVDPGAALDILVRSPLDLDSLTASARRSVAEVHPDISVAFRPFRALVEESLTRERLMATLSGFFGLLAGILAAVGLYGVMSYSVVKRRNEIGIRMALGADRASIVFMVAREAVALVTAGVVVGATLAFFSAKATKTLLFGLEPSDPATMVMSIAALACVAAIASVVPAYRASRLQPTVALRDE